MDATTVVALGGLLAGIVFGAVAFRTDFCTMGALSDIVFMGNYNRMRAWLLAIAVAILGTQGLHWAGIFSVSGNEEMDINAAIYLTPSLGWFGAILGGLLFGFGMTYAGGCGNKTLVRIGGGNLKSLVVFMIIGIVSYMTMRGLFGYIRTDMESLLNIDLAGMGLDSQGLPALIGAIGLGEEVARAIVVALIVGGILIYCFKDADFRGSLEHVVGGVIIGLLVPVGWYITGAIAGPINADNFESTNPTSFTFVAPMGDTVTYLMTYTGATINFGIAAVGGVILGAFLTAMATKRFNIETFASKDDMLNHMGGAVIMGIGGVIALGCTIGQGITGMSTLALSSLLALIAIIFGGLWGLKTQAEGGLLSGLKAVFTGE